MARIVAAILVSLPEACGGTSGRELLPQPTMASGNAGDAGDGSADGTVGDSPEDGSASGDDGGDSTLQGSGNGDFDVVITYADRVLPDIGAPPPQGEAGADGSSYPWPSCPPFLPVRGDQVVSLAESTNQVPAVYTDDGGSAFAPDGSACASYGWLGSLAIDECTTRNQGSLNNPAFPPCNWCVGAGVAVQGTMAGEQRYALCLALYQCIIQAGCGANIGSCLCGSESTAACTGDMNPPGPCAQLELASLEERPDSVEDALVNYVSDDPSFLGVCGSTLNAVFASASGGACFPSIDGGGR
jgi:hypothetical protein